jgi:hypothetical protein
MEQLLTFEELKTNEEARAMIGRMNEEIFLPLGLGIVKLNEATAKTTVRGNSQSSIRSYRGSTAHSERRNYQNVGRWRHFFCALWTDLTCVGHCSLLCGGSAFGAGHNSRCGRNDSL